MEGKLIKRGEGDYKLFVNDTPYAQSKKSPYKKLSIQNCQAIENGYDLDELAKDCEITPTYAHEQGFITGFQKALEILGYKKYTEIDLDKGIEWGITSGRAGDVTSYDIDNFIQSLQQTEWDVEIEMEQYVKYVPKSLATVYPTGGVRPKLDAAGNLILKRK